GGGDNDGAPDMRFHRAFLPKQGMTLHELMSFRSRSSLFCGAAKTSPQNGGKIGRISDFALKFSYFSYAISA
ncbi:MAG: hypothetical protein WA214_24625, partial [Pseudolabrys sp.]